MKFFKPEDFLPGNDFYKITWDDVVRKQLADRANAKLEREGKVVFGIPGADLWEEALYSSSTHTAVLINIEPIEKCTHPAEKVVQTTIDFQCPCGAKLKPKTFEEIS